MEQGLFLYHLTLKSATLTFRSVAGQFGENKKELHLVVSSSTGLEIFRPDAALGKLLRVSSQKAFAHVTSMAKLRLPGGNKDLLVLLSDLGNMSVCEFVGGKFVPLYQEPLCKSGMTRFSPCYVAANEKTGHVMVAALERTKLVYKMLDLGAPLENTAKNTWTLALAALEGGDEQSVWAALESRAQSRDLHLCYYVLDHGLHHVFQRPSALAVRNPSFLVPMPGHFGGVLVCGESCVVYDPEYSQNSDVLRLDLPIRRGSESTIITGARVHSLKKNDFFVLLQSSLGDLFKLTATHDQLRVTYFDSVPPCSSFDIFKSGFLYANTLRNDKLFYQFESLGEENQTTIVSEALEQKSIEGNHMENGNSGEKRNPFDPVGLQNLALVDIIPSLGPLYDSELLPSKLLTLSSHSYLKTLTHGFPVQPLVSSTLPSTPSVIYTTKAYKSSAVEQYLVLSSALDETTLVLSIGEVVEEVETKLVKNQYTLGVQQTGKSSIVQIHRNGLRNVRHVIKDGEVLLSSYTDWFPPAGISVLHCSANNEQILVALSNREICYFEVDPEDDQLVEYQGRMQVSEGSVTALALDVSAEKKSRFAAVASSDNIVQVFSLAENTFAVVTLQILLFACRSLLLQSLFLHMGMENGVYVRVSMDAVSGKLSDTRLKYLGAKPVELRPFKLPNQNGILAISSRPWIGFFDESGNLRLSPLINCNITCGLSFFSDDIGVESAVGIEGRTLLIFTVGSESGFDPNNEFEILQVKLRYLPKKMVRRKDLVYVLEADYGVVLPYAGAVDEDYIDAFGYEQKKGSWASCVQVVDHVQQALLQSIELDNNESAVDICLAHGHVIVALAKDVSFPNNSTAHYIYVYRAGDGLELVHKTRIDTFVSAICDFSGGRILVAAKDRLRLYEIGKKQILQKSATRIDYLRRVTKLRYLGGDTVLLGDGQSSVSHLRLSAGTNQFSPLVTDVVPRQVTAMDTLDARSVIVGDKFGNVCVNQISEGDAENFTENVLSQFQDEFLGGPGARYDKVCEFHVQDVPTSFSKGSFVQGGTESVVYTGLQGTVGIFLPVATVQEAKMIMRLETLMREFLDPENGQKLNLVGRDHRKFRGYYNPVKNVVDGDFVEQFYLLDQAAKVKIAGSLDRTPREVERKLYDLRNRGAF